jgi:hypothetical protein
MSYKPETETQQMVRRVLHIAEHLTGPGMTGKICCLTLQEQAVLERWRRHGLEQEERLCRL